MYNAIGNILYIYEFDGQSKKLIWFDFDFAIDEILKLIKLILRLAEVF